MSTTCSREEVLAILNNEGGELWYFYLEGGVAVHDKDGKPLGGRFCSVEIFLELRRQGVIVHTRRNETGYPYYADHMKSDVYQIAK